MSRAKTKLSEINEISQAVEAVQESKDAISAAEHKHLVEVYAQADAARQNLQQAIASTQATAGARDSFMRFLASQYGLLEGDSVEVATGKIIRK